MLNFFSNICIKLERVLFALHILLFLKRTVVIGLERMTCMLPVHWCWAKKKQTELAKMERKLWLLVWMIFFSFFKSWLAHIYEAPSIQFLENVEYTQKTDLTDQLGKKSGRRSVFLMLVFKIYFEWKKNTQVEKEREVRERNCEKPLNPIYQTILFPPGLPKAFNSHLT